MIEFENPVVIVGIPRSGTSMVGGLYHYNGFFGGNYRSPTPSNPKGFFENLEINQLTVEQYGTGLIDVREFGISLKDGIHEIMKRQGYKGGKWFIKTCVAYYDCYRDLEPEYILVRRSPNGCSASNVKENCIRGGDISVINEQNRILDELGEYYHQIISDELIGGDYSSLPGYITDTSFIDRELWHEMAG